MTDKHAAEIAAGLTEAQQNALAYWPGRYMDPNTLRALRRRSLVETPRLRLSPLGEQVRAHLTNPENSHVR